MMFLAEAIREFKFTTDYRRRKKLVKLIVDQCNENCMSVPDVVRVYIEAVRSRKVRRNSKYRWRARDKQEEGTAEEGRKADVE